MIVCTYKRPRLLEKALDSLANQTLEKSLFEIVVVDNAETNDSAPIVDRWRERYPDHRICRISELRPGLAYARNTGWERARGRYVAYMDDDAVADKNWLKAGLDCFRKLKPTPDCVGGPIYPAYDSPKPDWFKDLYEIRTWGKEARWLSQGEVFSGSNMIIKRTIVEQYGGFDVRAGMKGANIEVGEETSLFRRIREGSGGLAGFFYSPEMKMFHAVPGYKMTISYQLKRAYASGRAEYLIGDPPAFKKRITGVRVHSTAILRQAVSAFLSKRRYPRLQIWLVEGFKPVAIELGRLIMCLGLTVPVKINRRLIDKPSENPDHEMIENKC